MFFECFFFKKKEQRKYKFKHSKITSESFDKFENEIFFLNLKYESRI